MVSHGRWIAATAVISVGLAAALSNARASACDLGDDAAPVPVLADDAGHRAMDDGGALRLHVVMDDAGAFRVDDAGRLMADDAAPGAFRLGDAGPLMAGDAAPWSIRLAGDGGH